MFRFKFYCVAFKHELIFFTGPYLDLVDTIIGGIKAASSEQKTVFAFDATPAEGALLLSV